MFIVYLRHDISIHIYNYFDDNNDNTTITIRCHILLT